MWEEGCVQKQDYRTQQHCLEKGLTGNPRSGEFYSAKRDKRLVQSDDTRSGGLGRGTNVADTNRCRRRRWDCEGCWRKHQDS